tara:strand:+ start:233 stop:475 length:243 start_codon:yes stop_codon:yes gene_type:complete
MSQTGNISRERLRSLVERIEQLEEEKKALTEDIREVYIEAKSAGFEVNILRQLIKLRKMSDNDRGEMEATLSIYKDALEM